jgi:nucleotide-binding universal stress UspA family protein
VLGQQDPARRGASQVLVAWKPSAQAARAVAAAVPLLRSAREVHLVSWGADDAPACQGEALDIDGYLRRQGVSATSHRESAAGDDIGELMLSKAADVGADLLVMGCYAHSRVREVVMGGATRVVLQSMTVPVFASH